MIRVLYLGLIFYALFIIGCGGAQVISQPSVDRMAGVLPQDQICVTVPADGQFEGTTYFGSGKIVADRVAKALRRKYSNVNLVSVPSEGDDIGVCRAEGAHYAVVPEIHHWEDHATGWTGNPDHIIVFLAVYDLKSDVPPVHTRYEAKSNIVSSGLTEFGNRQPQYLLDKNFTKTVLSLFP
jgi:hypothetical protein